MTNQVQRVRLSDLIADPHNANRHTERGEYMIRRSIERFGFAEAGTLDANNRIIGGNARTVAAADVLDAEDAIIIDVDGTRPVYIRRSDIDLTTPEGRELAVALNRTAQVSIDFDPDVLAEFDAAGVDLDDWFTPMELDELGVSEPEPEADAEPQHDRAEELRAAWGVETGQLWRLPSRTPGQEHRLICGDCRDYWQGAVGALFWDPEWDQDWRAPDYQSALVFTDGYRMADCIRAFGAPAWVFTWDCVTSWYTPNRPLRRAKYCLWYGSVDDYRFDGAHYGDAGEPRTVANTRGRYQFVPDLRGKHLSDVFSAPITALHSQSEHSHSKPADWVRMLIANCTQGNIWDPFCGSGESIIAAENLSRQCRAVEISPAYVAVALQRYRDAFGIEPELIS